LLEDRFKLKVHSETRDVPVYALVVARGGPKLTAAKNPTDCGGRGCLMFSPGRLRGTSVNLANIAQGLSRNLDRPVMDERS
jgi:uncharacterized protein (TIGR03435 family)